MYIYIHMYLVSGCVHVYTDACMHVQPVHTILFHIFPVHVHM